MIDTPPGIDQIPIPSSNGASKRGRGRPPSIDPATGERVHKPKQAAKPKATRRRATVTPRSRGPRSLRPEIAAFLTLANTVVLMTPLGSRAEKVDPTTGETIPAKLGDELDEYEIVALAAAIDQQCTRSPRFRKYVENALAVGSGGALISTIGIIATRRASRHGLAPAMLDPMLGIMLAGGGLEALGNMTPPTPTDTAPDPDTGETPPAPIDFESMGGSDG